MKVDDLEKYQLQDFEVHELKNGYGHNGPQKLIHLEKWITWSAVPKEFNQEEFIEKHKYSLCKSFYEDLLKYLNENNFITAICASDFLEPIKDFPNGIIYFDEIPIRWTLGLFLQSAWSKRKDKEPKEYGMYADFIGEGK